MTILLKGTVPIDLHVFFHTMEVNGDQQLKLYYPFNIVLMMLKCDQKKLDNVGLFVT